MNLKGPYPQTIVAAPPPIRPVYRVVLIAKAGVVGDQMTKIDALDLRMDIIALVSSVQLAR